jgi:hypothetical protein
MLRHQVAILRESFRPARHAHLCADCTNWNDWNINSLNTKLNPICHLLALLGAHHLLHVSRVRVKILKYLE